MPPQITCASALPGKTGNPKITFFTCCISAFPELHQSLLHFFNLFDSWLILTLLYDSLNLVTNAFSLEICGAWFSRKEVESTAAVGLRCMHKAPVRWLLGFLFRKVMLSSVASGSAQQVAISSSCHDIVAPFSAIGHLLLQARLPGTRCQTISVIVA